MCYVKAYYVLLMERVGSWLACGQWRHQAPEIAQHAQGRIRHNYLALCWGSSNCCYRHIADSLRFLGFGLFQRKLISLVRRADSSITEVAINVASEQCTDQAVLASMYWSGCKLQCADRAVLASMYWTGYVSFNVPMYWSCCVGFNVLIRLC